MRGRFGPDVCQFCGEEEIHLDDMGVIACYECSKGLTFRHEEWMDEPYMEDEK